MARRRGVPRREGLPPGVRARRSEGRHGGHGEDRGDRDDDHVPARRGHLRGDRFLRRDARPAPARDRLPDQGPGDRPHGPARGRRPVRVQVRRRHPRLRRVHQRQQGPDPQADRLLRVGERRRHRRDRDAVELVLRRVGVLLREQHQHARGRVTPLGLQGRADRHAEQVRSRQGAPEGQGGEPRGRGRARRARSASSPSSSATRSSRARRRRSSEIRGCAGSSSRP